MIKAEAVYTRKVCRAFFWFANYRGKYYQLVRLVHALATLVLLPLAFVMLRQASGHPLTTLVALLSACCLGVFLRLLVNYPRFMKSMATQPETRLHIVFAADAYAGECFGPVGESISPTRYDSLHQAYETTAAFYLCPTPSQTLLVPKSAFVRGTPKDLRALLREKAPAYVRCL